MGILEEQTLKLRLMARRGVEMWGWLHGSSTGVAHQVMVHVVLQCKELVIFYGREVILGVKEYSAQGQFAFFFSHRLFT